MKCFKFLVFVLVLSLGALTGCQGAPKFGYNVDRSTPGNHVGAGRFYLDLNAGTKMTATGVESGRTGMFGTKFNASSLTIEQDHANFDGVLAGMDRYAIQQDRYFTGIDSFAKVIFDGIPPIIRELVPTLDKLIETRGNVAMQNALKPTVFSQAAAGILGGFFSLDQFKSATSFDPSIAAGVVQKLTVPASQSSN